MDEPVTSTAAGPVAHEGASQQEGASFRAALRRSAIGLAFGALYVLATSWFYSDGLLALLAALMFLHKQDDRRSRWALVAALLIAAPAALIAEVMLKGWLPQPWDGILYSVLGALPGSVAYAAVTQIPPKAQKPSA
ncbi:hypothetical protein NCC78_10345 [Micromonospora phytophila]|uniref:hypothetical protein n=1 Tax=Micromonospora phytophila TaxID=709888 RepID=UPI002030423E|nr:hypothetical protein [Micromonospora phytophila]MCM0675087.1 hypothetical protein [Micromonospora phytophila]